MLTLDTSPRDIVDHPLMNAHPYCRTALRLKRWRDASVADVLARPVNATSVDMCRNIRERVWHLCDEEMKAAVVAYLEKANA